MAQSRAFRPIADSLREEVLRYFRAQGDVSSAAAQSTLETNSGLVESRAGLLTHVLIRAGGPESLQGLRVVDLGCGFGALSVFFAAHGATVVGVDRSGPRMEVGAAVARRHGLAVEFLVGRMEQLELPDASFDLAIQNNSLCYIVPREDRARALAETWRVLHPGGRLVIHNPNRWTPRDQFSGLPGITMLPPGAAAWVAKGLRRPRSSVRLTSPLDSKRELRRAGFEGPKLISPPGGRRPAILRALARYQHLAARRPSGTDPGMEPESAIA